MSRPVIHSLGAGVSLLLGIVAFLAVNLAAELALGSARLDFTAGHIYTLSPATVDVLENLKEPVRLRLYASPALTGLSGQYTSYEQHVRTLLELYHRRSHGTVSIDIVAPEPYSPEEDRAVGFGLKAVPVDNDGNEGYFGIAGTNSTDQTQSLPFLAPDRETFLEYDLTRLVASLAEAKKPIIGLIDGTGPGGLAGGQGSKPWVAIEQARSLYNIRRIDPQSPNIDMALSVLVLVHPKNLPPATLFAIDQFVLRGGHVLAFVDPDCESVAASQEDMMTTGVPGGGSSDLPGLLKTWGVAYDPHKVVGDWDQAMRVEGESFGRPIVTEFPPYMSVKPPYLAADDPVTGNLKIVNLVTTGALAPVQGARTVFTPLIRSSPHSALVEADDTMGNADPLAFLNKYKQGNDSLVMAARIIGPVTTAFPDGPPKGADGKPMPLIEPMLKESAKPAEIIVVADVDILANHTWVDLRQMMGQEIAAPFASNGDFVVNALENLTGSPALAALRGRGIASHPLVRIDALQRAADTQYRATEESLSQKLDEARRKLLTLAPVKTGEGDDKPAALTDEQQDTVKHFRAEMSETRAELRDVQHNLRRDIDTLEHKVEFANIVIVPLAVVIFALLMAWGERARNARAYKR